MFIFGILNGLRSCEMAILKLGTDVIQYQINVDGLPLFRSSGIQLWPILGRVVGVNFPFLIGAFCGASKPGSIGEFLHEFVSEALTLSDVGFMLHDVRFRAQVVCFVCDAPARALIKQIKSHTGYYGCERCVQRGVYVEGRVTFPDLDAEKRTDENCSAGIRGASDEHISSE